MKIGFLGAHRTGKTTTAMMLAKRLGIPFVQTSTSDVILASGYDINNVTIAQRLDLQESILDRAIQIWSDASRGVNPFVTDRTPLDMAAYMLSEISSSRAKDLEEFPTLDERINNYVSRCIEATSVHFDCTIGLQPGITMRTDLEKVTAPLSTSYCWKINAMLIGLIHSEEFLVRKEDLVMYVLNADVTDLEQRLDICERFVGELMEREVQTVQNMAIN